MPGSTPTGLTTFDCVGPVHTSPPQPPRVPTRGLGSSWLQGAAAVRSVVGGGTCRSFMTFTMDDAGCSSWGRVPGGIDVQQRSGGVPLLSLQRLLPVCVHACAGTGKPFKVQTVCQKSGTWKRM